MRGCRVENTHYNSLPVCKKQGGEYQTLLWITEEKFRASECNQELHHSIWVKGMIKKYL